MKNLDVQQILPFVISAVVQAGQFLAQEYVRPGGRRGHGDKADIDLEIEEALRAELLNLLPCDWWGEETGHLLTGNSLCWVVDPNDGTSDFLRGYAGSAVSVGLLQGNVPVLGVVHAPVTAKGKSDCIAWAAGMDHLLRNGTQIRVDLSQQDLTDGSVVMVSTAASGKPQINQELCAPGDFYPMPSIAYRLARVAAGDGVCGVSLYPVSAHDVVAGHALLIGANGVLVDQDGRPIEYRTKAEMMKVSNRCFGGAPIACADLARRDWDRVFAKDANEPQASSACPVTTDAKTR
ncbi:MULTISPECIES: inositol monophosphatase family protein [Pseudomonas]|uniref:Inositol monophosphatase n=1 Tax=Pseudomonas kurunegalensis TaxID=485880 RepID=A0ACC5UNZ2_9PSED|nr:inositol monophosphatase family protein [Pseudomonas monteilii]MBV4516156.1 inositol monophosphatase [Pseudomonas kurunegalensis]